MTHFSSFTFCRIEGVSSRHKKVAQTASSSVITKFYDDLSTQDYESLKKTIQSSVKQDNWGSTRVAEDLLEKAINNNREDMEKVFRVALLINSKIGGEVFEKLLSGIAIKRYREGLTIKSLDVLTALSGFINKLYTIGWISGKSLLDCVELAASDEFATYEKVKIVKDLIKPVIVKLQTECFVDRFTFYFQLLRKRVNEDKLLEHREEYLELIDLLKSLSAVGDSTEVKESNAKLSSKDKKQIKLLLDETTKENFKSQLAIIAALVNKHLEKLDFLANLIVNEALVELESVPLYISIILQLNDLLTSGNKTEQFRTYISNASYRVLANVLVDARISDLNFKWTPTFLAFSCELYKFKILDQAFITTCLETFITADESCEKLVYCIVQIMSAVGERFEEENPKAVELYFAYFDRYIIDPSDAARALEFKKLIKFRKSGWKAIPEKAESIYLIHNSKSSTLTDPTQRVSVEPQEDNQKNKALTISFNDMSSDKNLDSTVANIRKMLTSDGHLKTFIKASLNRPSIDRRVISLQTKLLKKLSESYCNDTECQIDFGDFLIEIMNSELARTSALRCFDGSTKLEFTRLMIISGELFKVNLLSDDDFAPWLFHKHVNQVPVPILCDLVDSILPKIQSEGTKQLKLALIILETSIHTSTMEMSSSIQVDIGEIGNELCYYRTKALNVRGSPVVMMPPPNWFVGQPLGYMKGWNKQ